MTKLLELAGEYPATAIVFAIVFAVGLGKIAAELMNMRVLIHLDSSKEKNDQEGSNNG